MFGLGFTSKLNQQITELKTHISSDSKRIDKMSAEHKSQIAIRDGENLVLQVEVTKKDSVIETWQEKAISDQTQINSLVEANNTLKNDIKDRDKSLVNLQNGISELNKTIKHLEIKVVELQKPKARSKNLQAYYDRGKTKKKAVKKKSNKKALNKFRVERNAC